MNVMLWNYFPAVAYASVYLSQLRSRVAHSKLVIWVMIVGHQAFIQQDDNKSKRPYHVSDFEPVPSIAFPSLRLAANDWKSSF